MTTRRVAKLGLLSVLVALLPSVASSGAEAKAPKPPKPAKVSIGDVSVSETDVAGVVASFTVTLKRGSGKKVKVWWSTADGTATAPADYSAVRGKLVFKGPAKTQTMTIDVPVVGDDVFESNETFQVKLTRSKNGAIKRAAATATITNDDVAPVTLTVSRSGLGGGTVTSSPAGLACPGPCTLSAAPGTVVTLTAAADPASVFAGWSGACSGASLTCTVTMTGDKAVGAGFGQRLNFSLAPLFGSRSLISGFVPDPSMASVTGGGSVNVSYLGGACVGFTTVAPTFSVNYTAGAFPVLRYYFVGSADPVMVINGPSGTYRCVDDSFGTLNPTLDYNAPSSGRYDIWIGTRAGSTTGTLSITENTGNHP